MPPRVLAIGEQTDLVESVVHGASPVAEYVGLTETAEFADYCTHEVPQDTLRVRPFSPERLGGDPQWLLGEPFDVVVLRVSDQTSASAPLQALLYGARSACDEGARLVVAYGASNTPCADDGAISALSEACEAAGWRVDERRSNRRNLGTHVVATAVPTQSAST